MGTHEVGGIRIKAPPDRGAGPSPGARPRRGRGVQRSRRLGEGWQGPTSRANAIRAHTLLLRGPGQMHS